MKLGITNPSIASDDFLDKMESVLTLILQIDYKFKYDVDFAPDVDATKY